MKKVLIQCQTIKGNLSLNHCILVISCRTFYISHLNHALIFYFFNVTFTFGADSELINLLVISCSAHFIDLANYTITQLNTLSHELSSQEFHSGMFQI